MKLMSGKESNEDIHHPLRAEYDRVKRHQLRMEIERLKSCGYEVTLKEKFDDMQIHELEYCIKRTKMKRNLDARMTRARQMGIQLSTAIRELFECLSEDVRNDGQIQGD